MIFRPELVRLIKAGRKTQTRRPVPTKDGRLQPCRYRPGRDYAVQPGRGKASELMIHVEDVHRERLGAISYVDARREGFRTTDEFRLYWVRLHDRRWLASLEDDVEPLEDVELLARFDRRHADKPVHVITFRLADEARFLTESPTATGSDYTHQQHRAMRDEPEAISAAEQIRQSEDARSAERIRLESETRHDRELLQRAIDSLSGRTDLGEAAHLRIKRMRDDLRRLESELRA